MNRHPTHTHWRLLTALTTAIPLIGCAAQSAPRQTKTPAIGTAEAPPAGANDAGPSALAAIPIYETVEQLKTIPACKAAVHHLDEFSVLATTADGRRFTIGSPRGEQEVWHFAAMLDEGQTCELPGVFVNFENRKFYSTADEIKSMPACSATANVTGPCFSVFTATGGTMFVIGDPGSKPVVYRFLQTIEKGQACKLPSAFIEFQKGFDPESSKLTAETQSSRRQPQ